MDQRLRPTRSAVIRAVKIAMVQHYDGDSRDGTEENGCPRGGVGHGESGPPGGDSHGRSGSAPSEQPPDTAGSGDGTRGREDRSADPPAGGASDSVHPEADAWRPSVPPDDAGAGSRASSETTDPSRENPPGTTRPGLSIAITVVAAVVGAVVALVVGSVVVPAGLAPPLFPLPTSAASVFVAAIAGAGLASLGSQTATRPADDPPGAATEAATAAGSAVLGVLLTAFAIGVPLSFVGFLPGSSPATAAVFLVLAVATGAGLSAMASQVRSAAARAGALAGVGVVVVGHLGLVGRFLGPAVAVVLAGLVALGAAYRVTWVPSTAAGERTGTSWLPLPSRGIHGYVRTPQEKRIVGQAFVARTAPTFRLERLDEKGNRVGYVTVALWPRAQGTVHENDEVVVWGRRRRGKPLKARKLENRTTGEVVRSYRWLAWLVVVGIVLAIAYLVVGG